MSTEVTTSFQTTFMNNVRLKLQQNSAKLAPHAMQQSRDGEKVRIDNIVGGGKTQKKRTRNAPVEYRNSPHEARWVAMPELDYFAELIDREDRIATMIDIEGAYTQEAARVIRRAGDDAWIAGFYGPNLTGKDGATTTNFLAGNVVPVTEGAAAATGLNLKKLIAARQLLLEGDVDLESEQLYVAITAQQSSDLLLQARAVSADYIAQNGGMTVTQTGKLSQLMGFNLIECQFGAGNSFHSAGLTVNGSGHRLVPAWCKSGMAVNTFMAPTYSVDPLPQMHHATQVYAATIVAATRTDEAKCVQIACLES